MIRRLKLAWRGLRGEDTKAVWFSEGYTACRAAIDANIKQFRTVHILQRDPDEDPLAVPRWTVATDSGRISTTNDLEPSVLLLALPRKV